MEWTGAPSGRSRQSRPRGCLAGAARLARSSPPAPATAQANGGPAKGSEPGRASRCPDGCGWGIRVITGLHPPVPGRPCRFRANRARLPAAAAPGRGRSARPGHSSHPPPAPAPPPHCLPTPPAGPGCGRAGARPGSAPPVRLAADDSGERSTRRRHMAMYARRVPARHRCARLSSPSAAGAKRANAARSGAAASRRYSAGA